MTNEMKKLATMLIEAEIPFQVVIQKEWDNTPQICVPNEDNRMIDFVCNKISMGYKDGTLEAYVTSQDDVYGYLTAEHAFIIVNMEIAANILYC